MTLGGWINGAHCIDGLVYCDNFEVFHSQYSGHWNLLSQPGCYIVSIRSDFAPLNPFDSGSHDFKSTSVCSVDDHLYAVNVCTIIDGISYNVRVDHYRQGATLEYSPITPTGYHFTGWSGEVTSSAESITFQMPPRDITLCANFVQNPPPPPPDPGHDPNNIVDNSGCPAYQNCNSPIIINMGNGPYQLSGSNQPVSFDIDANGTLNRISWTAAGAPMAFLALDRNSNGTIDSGAELFGNHTPLPGGVAANGFDALAQYDGNADDVIDAGDPIWSSLLLWTDLNHDGISQASELALLSASAVTAIGLDYHWTGRRDQSGNSFRYESRVWIDSGRKHPTPRPVYDIYFIPAP